MTKDEDQRLTQEQAQRHPPSWSSIFGEDDGPSMFDDPGPSPRSSAAIHASRRRANDQAAQQARDQEIIAQVAEDDADSQALAETLRLADAGKPVPRDTMARAARAARARGATISSAEQLAKMRRTP